jgi:hypothetical protein
MALLHAFGIEYRPASFRQRPRHTGESRYPEWCSDTGFRLALGQRVSFRSFGNHLLWKENTVFQRLSGVPLECGKFVQARKLISIRCLRR